MVERDLMVRPGMAYDPAHDVASSYERGFRRQLRSAGVRDFDLRRLFAAYRGYLRNQAKLATPKSERHPRQIRRDVAASLSGRPR